MIEKHFYRYRDFQYKGKSVMNQMYLYNENTYISKIAILYWKDPYHLW